MGQCVNDTKRGLFCGSASTAAAAWPPGLLNRLGRFSKIPNLTAVSNVVWPLA